MFILLLLLSCYASAVDYPPLALVWNQSLGGEILDVRDIDNDGVKEITVGLLHGQSSYAYLLDNQGNLIWRNKISVIWPQNTPYTMLVDDIDHDNMTEIIVGSVIEAKSCYGQLSPYSNPLFVLRRNPELENNMLAWVRRGYGFSTSLGVSDIDGDGLSEIIAGSRDGTVYAIKYDGELIWKYLTEGTVNALHVGDLNGDKRGEILAGSYVNLYSINHKGNTIWRYQMGEPVIGVTAANIIGDKLHEVIASGDNDTLVVLTADGKLFWKKRISGLKSPVAAADIDGDGSVEVIAVSASYIHVFDNAGNKKFTYDVNFPIINIFATELENDSKTDLLVLGARTLQNYRINPDYVQDMAADNNMNLSKTYLANGSYKLSQNHALAAYDVYSVLGDGELTSKAQALNETAYLYLKASQLYSASVGNYSVGNILEAKELSIESEKIFIRLGDSMFIDMALRMANKAIDLLDAIDYYKKSINHYQAADYVSGSIYASKAFDLFERINDSVNMEKSKLLLEFNSEYPLANENHDKAFRAFELKNYTQAKEYALSSKASYTKVGDEGRIAILEKLIVKIDEEILRLDRLSKAKMNYERALNKKLQRNYHGCLEDVASSRQYYLNLTDSEGLAKADILHLDCERGIEAQQFFKKANEFYIENNYEAAIDYSRKARQLFRAVDDFDGGIEASDLITSITQEQASKESEKIQGEYTLYLYGILAFSAILIISVSAYFIYNRRRMKKAKEELLKKEYSEDFTKLIPGYQDENILETMTQTSMPTDEEINVLEKDDSEDLYSQFVNEDSTDGLLATHTKTEDEDLKIQNPTDDSGDKELTDLMDEFELSSKGDGTPPQDIPNTDLDISVTDGKLKIKVLDDLEKAANKTEDDTKEISDETTKPTENEGKQTEKILKPTENNTSSTLDDILAKAGLGDFDKPDETEVKADDTNTKKTGKTSVMTPNKKEKEKTAEKIKKELDELNKKLKGEN